MSYAQWMCLFLFLLGIALGTYLTCTIFYGKFHAGTLKIDHTNPEKDIYRLDFSVGDLGDLANKKWVLLKVDSKATLTQK